MLVISLGGIWCGEDREMSDSIGHVNLELQGLHEYAGSVELADVES